ncbi:uroporphyrinogen-III synthase [Hydrogenobacter sp. T-2]|uniref:uroporphyrinogen-III synthase n=1 Tax=Pampinifervens diazotrophicum TaxID=1632018 RepID=UPI002B25DDD9|nr:uroporphyrinogen-III synthase [Hydrogenobacter sp. T-2]WPM32900.1 uroporphyrinogen-III synthase [Hydrogenobacter sp. T-2]
MLKRIAFTRGEEDIKKDKPIFEKAGFQVLELPLIEEELLDFEPPKESFDFVVFQSPRAVKAFLSKCRLKGEKIVVVGEKTKKAVEEQGYKVWAMPENYYGEELIELFRGISGRVLLPKSAIGRDEVIEGLKALGLEVYALDVYTIKPKLYQKEELVDKLSTADAVVFASPSAVKGLLANLQKEEAISLLEPIKVVCIGKTTKGFFEREMGLKCLVPEKPSIERVVELLRGLA